MALYTVCSEDTHITRVCENQGELHISCVDGIVEIHSANYGRTEPSSDVCPYDK